jgi:N-acetylmuramoyl-L-alanine amidase
MLAMPGFPAFVFTMNAIWRPLRKADSSVTDTHRRTARIVRWAQSLMIGGAALFLATVAAQRAGGAEAETEATRDPPAPGAPPAIPQTPAADPHAPMRAGCKPEHFRIAIDVGHTPEAPGATSARGVKEHAFNLQLARRIQAELTAGGFARTALVTVHGSGRAQLIKRTELVNAGGADLLLSIHHDDVQDVYHEKWTHKGGPHTYSDRFSGYSLFVSRDNRRFEDSLLFARLLGSELTARGMHYSAHHAEPLRGEGRQLVDTTVGVYRYDGLFVLRFSDSPAVLMEAGIIVNRKDEIELASPEGQGHISAAVLAALNQLCTAPSARR